MLSTLHVLIELTTSIKYCICVFRSKTHILAKLWTSAMLVKSQKAKIFQVEKRNIKNHKMIDNWGNAKIASPR
jgi:hypothetical protein